MPDATTSTGERLELTPADRLIVQRRRLGESQSQAAARWKVAYHVYSSWECGEGRPPEVSVGQLRGHERALVYRRHAGRTQREVAEDLGVCVLTLRRMERGESDPGALLEYWEC